MKPIKTIVLLSTFTLNTFAGSFFDHSFILSEVSKNWEDRMSCEQTLNYMPEKCSQENVTCELISHGGPQTQRMYNVCTTYQKVVDYLTNEDQEVYIKLECISPLASLSGISPESKIAELKIYDNKTDQYYRSKNMTFTHTFNSENECLSFVESSNDVNRITTEITINYQSKKFSFKQ